MRKARTTPAAIALATALVLIFSPGASAAISNGDFETGTLAKWKHSAAGDQAWRIYDQARDFSPPLPAGYEPTFFNGIPDPLGDYSPVIDQEANPGTSYLYRNVKLPKKAEKLNVSYFFYNFSDFFNLGSSWSSGDNQYFSIQLLRGDQLDSIDPADVVHTFFAPEEGPVLEFPDWVGPVASATPKVNRSWTKASWKVPKKYRGKQLFFRVAVSVFDAPLQVGVDNLVVKKSK